MPTTDIEDHNDIQLADGVTAYHGSPHEFEEFDPAFIGTGEGAQAYGHGLYFAENEDVAKQYRDSLGQPTPIVGGKDLFNISPSAAYTLIAHNGDIESAIEHHRTSEYGTPKIAETLESLRGQPVELRKGGHMYEVRIDAHPEKHMLDWDKPLNEQQAYNLVRKHWEDRFGDPDIVAERIGIGEESTGRDLYEALSGGQRKQKEASKMLSDLGVRGIRYADQGSRPHGTDSKIKKDLQSARNNLEYLNKSSDPENEYLKELSKKHIAYLENILNDYASTTTHNYVIFNPKHIKTVRRYAEGGGIKAFAIGNSIPHLEQASDMIDTHDDIQLAPGVEAMDEMPDQAFTSENTSRNQIPALFNSSAFERKRGSRNLDYGGGAFDRGSEYLSQEHGVDSQVYDPFNREKEHNDFVLKGFKKEPADTATVANVLNVIAEPEARLHVIKQVHNHIKPDGKAYFTVYEGDGKEKGSGNSRMTRDGWQEYRPTHSYVEEIKQVFPDVRLSGKTIVASKKAAKAYGGALIPGPKLTEENADDFARRLIAWTFATAPLFHKASGGSVIDDPLDVISKLRR